MLDTPQGVDVLIDGRRFLSFCSNDYLGLANHPEVVTAFHKGLDDWGAGSGAAHLVSGHTRAHHELEEQLADFTQRPRALLFSTGYMANLGVMAALLGHGDRVFEDHTNHASLLTPHGWWCAPAAIARGCGDLAARLGAASDERLVATDGVFSMDGDIGRCSLPRCVRNTRPGAWWMMRTAGRAWCRGRGSLQAAGRHEQVPILMNAGRHSVPLAPLSQAARR
jgi:8-amino-7-oxononanoate synthase